MPQPDSLMGDPKKVTIYRAKWIVPVATPPIENGCVTVADGKVLAVGNSKDISTPVGANIVDIEDGVIIPGLVNAHTHLEFSDLESPIGQPGIAFTDWVRKVIRFKIERSATGNETASSSKDNAIQLGLHELANTGTVAVGEIATDPCRPSQYVFQSTKNLNKLHRTIFLEQLGGETTLREKQQQVENFLAEFCQNKTDDESDIISGLSPHAPYSTGPLLLEQMLRQSRKFNFPVAMHLGETREEIELLNHQTGAFVEMLKALDVWNPQNFMADYTIAAILNRLSSTPRALVVHGNYLNASELDIVHSARDMHLVFCPRTHYFFNHDRYPIDLIRQRDINLAVGTDSRASNPDLNLLSELQLIRETFPDLDDEFILQMGTINGANALGINDRFGSIEAGKTDQLAVVRLASNDSIDSPFNWLRDRKTKCELLNSDSA